MDFSHGTKYEYFGYDLRRPMVLDEKMNTPTITALRTLELQAPCVGVEHGIEHYWGRYWIVEDNYLQAGCSVCGVSLQEKR